MSPAPLYTAVTMLAFAWSVGVLAEPLTDEDYLALVYGDKATVSIATGSPRNLRRAPSVASVITAEDIAAMGATDLDEVLETVPGVHVSRTNTYFSTYVVRGVYGQFNPQVLILQNGVPLTTLYRGDKGGNWAGLTLENVARIEVMRGPGSALYGAEAFTGVVNIITKTAVEMPGTEVGARAGSFNSWNAWVQNGGKWSEADVATYVHVGSTDGQKRTVTADAQTARDLARGTNASLAPGSVNTGYDTVDASLDLGYEKWRFRVDYRQRSNAGTGAGVSSALDPVGKVHNERGIALLSWSDPQVAENWGIGYTGSFMYNADTFEVNMQLSPPGTQFTANPATYFPNGMLGDPERYERQLRLSGYAVYSGFAGHNVRLGAGHDDLNMYKTGTHKNYLLNAAGVPIANPTDGTVIDYYSIQSHILPQRRKIDYAYAQDEWNFTRDWTLTAGVRHDRYSDFGGSTNPRMALVWDATLDLTAKLLLGKAFRAPSFNELYGINPVANGNPNLKPEKILTWEAAFSWQAHKDLQLDLSFFRYDIGDAIRAVANPVAGTGSTFQNTGSQHGSGLELETAWDLSQRLRLSGNYSYQKSIDDATGQDAGYAPHHHAYARVDWVFSGNWLFSTQANWVADRKRTYGDTRAPVPDYTTVDLTLRSNFGKNRSQWEYVAGVRNLFDADVREPSQGGATGSLIPNDLPIAPRSVYVQASCML